MSDELHEQAKLFIAISNQLKEIDREIDNLKNKKNHQCNAKEKIACFLHTRVGKNIPQKYLLIGDKILVINHSDSSIKIIDSVEVVK